MTHIALSSQQRSLVKELADAWQSGSVVIPAEGMLPSDLDTAEAMQDELARALDFVCGAHKLGATVRAVRERLGLARTFYGIVPR